ncbi:putative alpha crystallin/Hsp20 domain, HSP20-like chaperone [Helianthus annuus]|uniref:Alpha crystallin/Hsp20 domain, HSP20-like chaperone n=1 Tax=Helianthus annuus TaxID=4232 RepID=A0A251RWD5_HELAN|nr:inactive protein RESTRICTED TEV MOVEMENT 2 [Helianthus annuus]KAF5758482.1 putative alpha crystallin/Hsp20 domain, HSP20-like chaperone [Helianthus annuus]KAJ0459124.1 putative alpha crystallin/Hsp20 domain, HSP20-like chaperone [Helianthus annuus]KAJ0639679.1 putative alpha crystallin/Hsp20 domain, HSP20-like chaperone [Helianthus annuus]
MAYNAGRSLFGDKQSSSLVFEEFVPPSAWTEDATCHYLLVDLPGFKKHELKLQVDDRTHIIVSGERQVRENKYKRFEQKLELPKDADIEKITGKLDGEILYISVPKKVEQVHNKIKHAASNEDEADNDKKSDTSDSDDEQKHKNKHKQIKHGSIPAPAAASESDSDSDANNKKSDAYESEESDNKDDENDQERMKHRTGFDDNWGQDAELFLRLAIEKLRKNKKIVATAVFAFTLGVFVTQKFQSNGN